MRENVALLLCCHAFSPPPPSARHAIPASSQISTTQHVSTEAEVTNGRDGNPYLASQCSSISTKRPRRNAQWWADKEDWIIFDVLDWVAAAAAALLIKKAE